ncbi:hypothetical protein ONS95_007323 [Cadophora gregata]|uniref:uncharacterized protein n=1 Tax=Cadophora gregata TaxID=51156 RepID=UPI0026DD3A53|nr:uncharacterized protein ONS95_007323 [Cadophora gregata]KAK0100878.1 hypothetical protein ONS95_007323 [Cadophora gregata]KAK0117131.1 hypothetical protein ONS96_012965 [Cadophora gregata f. sp. sojae]
MNRPKVFSRPGVAIFSGFAALGAVIAYGTIGAEYKRLLAEREDVVAEIKRLRKDLNIQVTDEEYWRENLPTRMRFIDIVRWFTG